MVVQHGEDATPDLVRQCLEHPVQRVGIGDIAERRRIGPSNGEGGNAR